MTHDQVASEGFANLGGTCSCEAHGVAAAAVTRSAHTETLFHTSMRLSAAVPTAHWGLLALQSALLTCKAKAKPLHMLQYMHFKTSKMLSCFSAIMLGAILG